MTNQQLFKLNIVSYGVLLALLLLAQTPLGPFTSPWQVILALFIMLYVSGANITVFIQKITRNTFDTSTTLTLSVLSSILMVPLITLALFLNTGHINTTLVFVSYALPIALVPLFYVAARIFPNRIIDHKLLPISYSLHFKSILKHPVTWALVLVGGVHIINITQFTFLPAPDIYSLLISFEQATQKNQLMLVADNNRWAFASLIQSVTLLTNLSLYTILKYLFPFLSILTLLPLWLMAQQLRHKLTQFLVLSTTLISSTLILELEFGRDQTIFLIFLYFALGLLVEAARTKNATLFFLVGIFSLSGILMHPTFVLFVLSWLIALGIKHRQTIWRHKITSILVLLAAYPWLGRINVIHNITGRLIGGYRTVILQIGDWNFAFPTRYINADAYDVSWPGVTGVLKYYAFYMGPYSLAIIISLFLLLSVSEHFRKFLRDALRHEYTPIITGIIFFLLVAEILPRTSNLAYLPDRAWQFTAILLVFPLYLILSFTESTFFRDRRTRIAILTIFLISTSINIGGAFYINYLNDFTMPAYELRAADWIKHNLPPTSFILTPSSSKNLIRYHAQVNYVKFQHDNFQENNPAVLMNNIKQALTSEEIKAIKSQSWHNPYVSEAAINYNEAMLSLIKASDEAKGVIQQYSIANTAMLNQKLSANQLRQVRIASDLSSTLRLYDDSLKSSTQEQPEQTVYLYYAQTHPRNPYAFRPYKSSFNDKQTLADFPALQNYPAIFELVYQDNNDVYIWRTVDKIRYDE